MCRRGMGQALGQMSFQTPREQGSRDKCLLKTPASMPGDPGCRECSPISAWEGVFGDPGVWAAQAVPKNQPPGRPEPGTRRGTEGDSDWQLLLRGASGFLAWRCLPVLITYLIISLRFWRSRGREGECGAGRATPCPGRSPG